MGHTWRRMSGLGGGFTFERPPTARITDLGEHSVALSGAWAPGDPVSPTILWGYRPAARLRSWSIHRQKVNDKATANWTLEATVESIEAFMVRQQPLVFAAPRRKGGFWLWPVIGNVQQVGTNQLRATLGQPEY